jgi:hypothetical protein
MTQEVRRAVRKKLDSGVNGFNRLYVMVRSRTATTVEKSSLCSKRAAEHQAAALQEARTRELK